MNSYKIILFEAVVITVYSLFMANTVGVYNAGVPESTGATNWITQLSDAQFLGMPVWLVAIITPILVAFNIWILYRQIRGQD